MHYLDSSASGSPAASTEELMSRREWLCEHAWNFITEACREKNLTQEESVKSLREMAMLF